MEKIEFDEKLGKIPFPDIKLAKKVSIIGNYGGGNLGDEAMLDVLVELLFRKLGKVKIVIPSRRPNVLRKLHPWPSVYPTGIIKGVLATLSSDLVIIGGGTIFSAFSGPGITGMTIIAIIRKVLFRKKVYFYGIGYSSSTSRILSILAKIAFKVADGIYVRDSISLATISRIIKTKPIILMPELGLFLKKSDSVPMELISTIKEKKRPAIGLSLMYINSLNYKELADSIIGFIEYLYANHNASFWFLTFQPRIISYNKQWKSDQEIASMIVDQLPEKIKTRCHVLPAYSPSDTLSIISELDLIVSMRYHCLVFAHTQGKPFIAISFEDKHRGFVRDYNGQSIDLNKIAAASLIEKWEAIKQ